MFTDHERFKNITAGIQALVLAIAIPIGGVWTMLSFQLLNQMKLAEAQLRAQLNELRERRVVNIDIKASQTTMPHDTMRYVSAMVEITNVGNYSEILQWHGPPFRVRQVLFGNHETPKFGPPTGTMMPIACGEDSGTEVLPGEIVRLPCIAKVTEPGFYYITFTVSASEAIQREIPKEVSSKPVEWSSATYIIVE